MSDYSTSEPTESGIDEYVDMLCFAISRGTANVSASDRKKLHGLLSYYAKKARPFTACVRDNRKRFGAHTEEYCAVLKDLIVGNTKWRGKGKKYTPRNLSEDLTIVDEFLTEIDVGEIPEGFMEFVSSLTDEDIELMTSENIIAQNLASAEIVWEPKESSNYIRSEIQRVVNKIAAPPGTNSNDLVQSYWVDDITANQALICYDGEFWVAGYKTTDGDVEMDDKDLWTKVEKAWVESNYSEGPQNVAEMFFSGSDTKEEDGLIWKTIMREGVWKYSPGYNGTPVERQLTVVEDGKSNYKANRISLTELKDNFDSNAKQHVTIPTSHANNVLENTGYVRELRIGKDEEGRATLEAACDFTELDVREKAVRGTIPNTSAGVKFDFIKKDTGDRFNAILDHVALTPNPWLTGMKPFGLSEDNTNFNILSFSEENGEGDMSDKDTTANDEGGVIVSTQEVETTTITFFDEIGLSEDEIKERLSRLDAVEAEVKKNRIESKCATWKDEGKTPAVIAAAREALLADSGEVALNLSEDGKSVSLTLSDVVERLVAASPSQELATDPINEEDVAGDGPKADATDENLEAEFSDDERAEIAVMMFDHGMNEEAAIAKVRSEKNSGK